MKRILVLAGVLVIAVGTVVVGWVLISRSGDSATTAFQAKSVTGGKRCALFSAGGGQTNYSLSALGYEECKANSQYLGWDTNGNGDWFPMSGDEWRQGRCHLSGTPPSSGYQPTSFDTCQTWSSTSWDSWLTSEPVGQRCRINRPTLSQGCVPY